MKRLFRDWRFYAVIGLLAMVCAFVVKGGLGLAGMAIGLVGTTLNMLAMRWATVALGRTIRDDAMPKSFSFGASLAFLIKLPALVLLGLWAISLGPDAGGCFLIGLALVYSFLVGWVLAEG